MKAVVWTAPGSVETRRLPVPSPGAGEAVVRVRAAGICGTDLSILNGKHPRARAPLVMGHELSGEVAETGEGVTALRVGDRVVCEPLISCGACHACRSGYPWVCQKLGLYGIDRDGAFAEYVSVAASSLRPIPDTVDDRLGALVEPMAVAVHAVRLSSLRVGDDVCILGGGPIGLLIAVVARLAGPARLFLTEREPYRIDLARGFGLDVIDAGSRDVEREVAERTGSPTVLIEHIDGAEEKIERDRLIDVIETQPKQFHATLHAILLLAQKRKNVFTGDVYDVYRKVCSASGQRPLTQRRISDIIAEMDMLGIVSTRVISKGRYGRTREIVCSLDDKTRISVEHLISSRLS